MRGSEHETRGVFPYRCSCWGTRGCWIREGGLRGSRKSSKEHLMGAHTLQLCQAQFVLDHDIITGHWPYTGCCGMHTEPRKESIRKTQLWKESPTKTYRHASREQRSGSDKESTGLQTEIFSSIEKCRCISSRNEEECQGGWILTWGPVLGEETQRIRS